MIERVIENIVKDLGSTGLLLIGLYVIVLKGVKCLAKHIEQINHNTTIIAETFQKVAEKLLQK